jgi:peroxisomal membrane protein 4
MFVCLYKALVCLLNNAAKKNRKEHSLIAGGIVGYLIFKEKTAVNNQIILYLLSRNLVGFFNNL